MKGPTVDEVIKGYIKLRDHKKTIKGKHQEELAPVNEKMQLLEGWLQRDLQNRKVDSQKTKEGTAYLMTATKATVKDREAFLAFVREKGMWELIENRVAKSVVDDYLESTGEIIPGVHYERRTEVRIRR